MDYLRGKFIVFDGGEGCGKSTQARLLHQHLSTSGVPAILVRDPGATRLGEAMRAMLLDPANGEMAMRTEMLLYMAARAQMMKELIFPALSKGKCVISDRFVSSTLAYQAGGDGLTAGDIRAVGDVAVSGRWPDLTILLDLPPQIAGPRMRRPLDRIEQRPPEYHAAVRQRYLDQAKNDPERFALLDASSDIPTVQQDVLVSLAHHLAPRP